LRKETFAGFRRKYDTGEFFEPNRELGDVQARQDAAMRPD
jgi:hypothetical protein